MKKKINLALSFILLVTFLTGLNTTNVKAENEASSNFKVGDYLGSPEDGWKRYDDVDKNITYDDNWTYRNAVGKYKQTDHKTSEVNASLKFSFTGDKLRIISQVDPKNSKSLVIKIDKKEYDFSVNKFEFCDTAIAFEKIGLEDTEHSVEIINKDGWFNLDAIDISESGELKPYEEKENINDNGTEVLNENVTIESEIDKLSLNKEFSTDIVLHSGKNICAEDIKISYNKDLFEYIGFEQIDGLRVNKEIKNTDLGNLRFIVSSLGKKNAINGDKTMLRLKFKSKAAGKGKIDVIKTRIANNGTIEKDIPEDKCGEKEFTIISDVNRDNEFSLLDLGIDSWYYGSDSKDTDITKFDTDIVINGKVDDDDLTEITNQLIINPNYEPNK